MCVFSRASELMVVVLLWLTKAKWCSCTKVPRAASDLSVAMRLSQLWQRAASTGSSGFTTLKADTYFTRFVTD